MKQRCFNPNNTAAPWYHDRGIRVCDEWLVYENFENWALRNGYADNLTIDRIDPDGNYEPSNCRWITLADNRARRRTPQRRNAGTGKGTGKYMVVNQKSFIYGSFVEVVATELMKSEALALSNELNAKKRDYHSFYLVKVSDGCKKGDLVRWEKLRSYQTEKRKLY